MGQNHIFDFGHYPFHVMVSIGQTDQELKKALSRYNIKSEHIEEYLKSKTPTHQGRCIMFVGGQMVIWIKNSRKHPKTLATLQHELFHAIEFLFERIGIPYSQDTSEAWAYLIEYMTNQIYTKFKLR